MSQDTDMTNDEWAKAIIIHLTGQPSEPTPMLLKMIADLRGSEKADDPPERTEATMKDPILQFFSYAHLRGDLQRVSKQFSVLAYHIVDVLPRNPERTVALRKLMEAKDSAVRAKLYHYIS